jgi:hypothetical protein
MRSELQVTAAAEPVPKERRAESGILLAVLLAGLVFVLHILTISRYGYFRDELYYLACSHHMDWGYVDQPPMIVLITWVTRSLLGESLFALRLLPALAGSAIVILTAVIAREMGGGRFAQAFSALCMASAGIYLILGHILTMNAFEPLLWMGCAYVLILMIKRRELKLWIWFGLLAGLGLETKYSILIFGLGIVVGLVLTQERRLLTSKWLLVGAGIALAIFLPNLVWNIQHHWPFVELMRNIKNSGRDITLGPVQFILQQVLLMTPTTAFVWIAGLVFLFFSPRARPYRALAWAYVVALVLLILMKGKNYYLVPAYPMLMAAGALAIERASARASLGWIKPLTVAAVLIVTVLLLPAFAPVLSVDSFLSYQDKLPFQIPRNEKSHLGAALPQYYADDFGWEEMAAAVAGVYNGLSPDEQAKTAIYCGNYGEAGAIAFFGRKYGLPEPICPHQNYFLWGSRGYTGEIMILVGSESIERAKANFDQVEAVADLNNPYAISGENRPVLLARGLKGNLQELWPKLKAWD